MNVRRLVFPIIVGLVVAVGTIPASALARAPAPPTPQTVGIRLLDAPKDRSTDPRAHEYIVDHLAQGTTITRSIEITNSTSATQKISLYPAAATISGGSFQFGVGHAANDLTTWTTINPPTVSPASGAKVDATVTIAIPADAPSGERYAVIWAELPAAVPPGGGVAAVNRVGIRIYLSVGEGAEPPTDFSITALQAERNAAGNPTVVATVQNTGGRAVDLSGELTLTNGPGGLSAGPFPASLGTTLGIGQTEPVFVALDRAIPAGPWDATIVLDSGLTQHQASATITFPLAPASAAKPVPTHLNSKKGNLLVPLVAGIGTLAILSLLFFGLRFRTRLRLRRGPPTATAATATAEPSTAPTAKVDA